MESMADIIVVSQLDLLDTAGTPRPPPTGSGTNRSSTIYRAPGPMAVRAPSHSALESQEMEESFEEDDDRTRLVAVKVEDPNASSDTVSELPRESKKEKENAKAKAKEEKLLHEPEISIMKSATLAEMDPDAVPKKSFFEANLGLLWMLLAAAQFTIMSISVKAMTTASERLPTLEIIFARSLLVWVMGVVCMFYWGVEDIWFGPKGVRGLLLLRSGIGFCGLVCGWWALSMLTLADATVLGFLSPVFTAILARFILKEPYALLDAVTGGLSMLGVLFIARPSFIFGSTTTSTDTTPDDLLASGAGSGFGAEGVAEEPGLASPSGSTAVATVEDSTQFLGVLIGLAGATFGALVYIVVRRLCGRATPLHIVSVFSLVSIPLSLILAAFMPSPTPWIVPSDPLTYMFLLLISASAYGGQLCVTKSLQLESAGKASSMNYVQVIVAFLAEWIIWGRQPTMSSVIGGSIVGSSIVIITVSKLRASSQDR